MKKQFIFVSVVELRPSWLSLPFFKQFLLQLLIAILAMLIGKAITIPLF